MIRSGLVILFLLDCLFSFSQKQRPNQIAYNKAKEHIHSIKNNGVILVRLEKFNKKISALESRGFTTTAQQEKEKIKKSHQEIVYAFSNFWNICPVYFFYSEKSKEISEGNFLNNVVDEMGKPTKLNTGVSVYIIDSHSGFMPNTQDTFYGYAVLDGQLNQLESPFPFFIRKRASIPFLKRNNTKMTVKLNSKLELFYFKTTQL